MRVTSCMWRIVYHLQLRVITLRQNQSRVSSLMIHLVGKSFRVGFTFWIPIRSSKLWHEHNILPYVPSYCITKLNSMYERTKFSRSIFKKLFSFIISFKSLSSGFNFCLWSYLSTYYFFCFKMVFMYKLNVPLTNIF